MRPTQSAIIIGGGIIGAACALYLRRAGFSIHVVEPGQIAGGTTAAGMGHVVVIDTHPAEFALTLRSRKLWTELAPELPPHCNFRAPGTLWLAQDKSETDEAKRKYERLTAAGVGARVLEPADLRQLEPELSHGLAGGLLVENDCILKAEAATHWLLGAAGITDAEIVRRRATAISSGEVTLDSGEILGADVVVNAAGLAARTLMSVPLRARKGHLTLTQPYPEMVSHQLVELGYIKSAHDHGLESVAFNLQPRRNGQLLVGSSRQFDVESTQVDRHVMDKMMARAREFMPRLDSMTFTRAWTGLRAATPDGLPIIGMVSQMPGVFAACGHEGLGVTTALATGELIAALATGGPTAIDPRPYSPDRFIPAMQETLS